MGRTQGIGFVCRRVVVCASVQSSELFNFYNSSYALPLPLLPPIADLSHYICHRSQGGAADIYYYAAILTDRSLLIPEFFDLIDDDYAIHHLPFPLTSPPPWLPLAVSSSTPPPHPNASSHRCLQAGRGFFPATTVASSSHAVFPLRGGSFVKIRRPLYKKCANT